MAYLQFLVVSSEMIRLKGSIGLVEIVLHKQLVHSRS